MKKHIIISSILFFIATLSFASGNYSTKNTQKNGFSIGIKNIEIISDTNFKRDLIRYLYLDEKLEYEKIYYLLSKEYLKNNFPKVNSAKEYEVDMLNTSEAGASKYLEIIACEKIKNNKYKVELIFETNAEGELIKIKTFYYFVNEGGEWKYDGMDVENYTVFE